MSRSWEKQRLKGRWLNLPLRSSRTPTIRLSWRKRRKLLWRNFEKKFRRFQAFRRTVSLLMSHFSSRLDQAHLLNNDKFFSGNKKPDEGKVEIHILPKELYIWCSSHYPGSVSDFEKIWRGWWRNERIRKDRHREVIKWRWYDVWTLSYFIRSACRQRV